MTGTPWPNPQRITLALDLCQLYGPEVDIALGGVEPMVDQWETGELTPTPEQIQLLADLTDFLPGFFYRDDPPDLGHVFICSIGGASRPRKRTTQPDQAVLRPTRRRAEPVDDTSADFITPARAREIRLRHEAEQAELADAAPAHVTGCARPGCPGQDGHCYLPATRCGRS